MLSIYHKCGKASRKLPVVFKVLVVCCGSFLIHSSFSGFSLTVCSSAQFLIAADHRGLLGNGMDASAFDVITRSGVPLHRRHICLDPALDARMPGAFIMHTGVMMILLLDLDGVLADFDRGFAQCWQAQTGNRPLLSEQRQHFHIADDYEPQLRESIEALIASPGFYEQLPMMAGASEAVSQLSQQGIDLRVVSSASTRPHINADKRAWIRRHLGDEMAERCLMSEDKTLIRGDFLIDDNPLISGCRHPDWQHILYDHAYNRHIVGRRIDWSEAGRQRLLHYLGRPQGGH